MYLKGLKKIEYEKCKHKKVSVALSIPDKIDFSPEKCQS